MSNRSFGVYVIEIDGLRDAVYVGQSALPAEERLENHLSGYKASRVVRRHGGVLRPELYGHLPRYAARDAAEHAEAQLAAELRQRGFTVHGGH